MITMAEDFDAEDVLLPDEAAALLKVSRSKLKQLVRDGAIPSFKVGHARRFRRSSLWEWIKQLEDDAVKTARKAKRSALGIEVIR